MKFKLLIALMAAAISCGAQAKTVEQNGVQFHIDDAVAEKHAGIVDFLLSTDFMNDEGRQQWLDALPQLADEQIAEIFQHLTLMDLILKSESMDNDEKQHWLSILPNMDEEQRTSLFEKLGVNR